MLVLLQAFAQVPAEPVSPQARPLPPGWWAGATMVGVGAAGLGLGTSAVLYKSPRSASGATDGSPVAFYTRAGGVVTAIGGGLTLLAGTMKMVDNPRPPPPVSLVVHPTGLAVTGRL